MERNIIENKILESDKVVSESLAMFFELKKYNEIMLRVRDTNIAKDFDFQRKYVGFYKVRRGAKWREKYFGLMENYKNIPFIGQELFKELLTELYSVEGNKQKCIEVSFASKLIATINPDMPIWDSKVLEAVGLTEEWKSYDGCEVDKRIEAAAKIYGKLEKLCNDLISSAEGEKCIEEFNKLFPNSNISEMKIIDYWLWSKRN